MRIIDTTEMQVVLCGDQWPLETDPCSKESIKALERNERIVSWLQPKGGRVEVRHAPCRQATGAPTMACLLA